MCTFFVRIDTYYIMWSLPDMQCSGDITAVNINGLPLEGIENRYWRKSLPQVINVPVKLGHVEFL